MIRFTKGVTIRFTRRITKDYGRDLGKAFVTGFLIEFYQISRCSALGCCL